MMSNYYVYEIVIDGIVRYVGISNTYDLKYATDDIHRYKRLQAHGMLCEPLTARRRLESNKIGRFKREILEAKADNIPLSFNILGENFSESAALQKEQELINKYGVIRTKMVEVEPGLFKQVHLSGQLLNKINSPLELSKFKNENAFENVDKSTTAKNWWKNLSCEERAYYKSKAVERLRKWNDDNPDAKYEAIKKANLATRKEFRTEETRRKQAEAMKCRWARNEYWIEAKNKQSSEFMKRLMAQPEQKERSKKAMTAMNKDPEWQKRKVKKYYFLMLEQKLNIDEWRASYRKLCELGLVKANGFRDWTKYFNTKEEFINYCNI